MGGQREGGGTTTATEGGVGQEERGKSGGNTLSRQSRKRPRTEKSDTETVAGGQAGPSWTRYKGHMTNIYLRDSDEEAIVDFVKDHKE